MPAFIAFILCALCVLVLPVSATDSGFHEAVPGRTLTFPRDHGKHPDFKTEWWYFTGNLDSDQDAETWGFQLTFFRRSMVKDVAPSLSRWGVRDVYMAHFALSDVKNRRFFHSQLMSREGPGLAAAAFDNLEVSVRDWAARMEDGVIRISARDRDYALSLRLIPEKPLVLHGTAGFSRKSPAKDQASYYYSFTRLRADGALTFKGRNHAVSGLAWMDHEFSSSMVLPDQSGWDWFCVQLDDGSELMISRMRKKTGAFERPFGTLVERDGTAVDLESQEVDIAVARTWTSPHSKAIYPSGWTLSIPGRNITLHVEPVFEDQELAGPRSLGVVYWEGAVTVSGSKDGRAVKGKGYVELTGYAGPLGGLL